MKKAEYIDEPYNGYTNEEIRLLRKKLFECIDEQANLERKIQIVRDNCEHVFLLAATSMYEDTYTCKYCGEDSYK